MNIKRKRIEYQPIVDTSELERKAIERLKEYGIRTPEGRLPILAFSGGKDSLATYIMCIKAGIEFVPIYSPTSVDPPELVQYITKVFNPYCLSKGYPAVKFNKYKTFTDRMVGGKMTGKYITMWTLVGNRAMPPTRGFRYCCDVLKERTGEKGDTVITGVRWDESRTRANQKMVNFYKGKMMVRPIVDWTDIDVWSLILTSDFPYCKLYDEGWDRLGCIGCPLGKNPKRELDLYPEYKRLYIRTFDNLLKYREWKGMETQWKTGEEVYNWWVGIKEEPKKDDELEGQCSIF